jgi:hypothetical protein
MNLCLWSRIPKTGSTSLHERFASLGVYHRLGDTEMMAVEFPRAMMIDCGHRTPQQLVMRGWLTENTLRRAFVFCVVRNPWARLASLWYGLGKENRWTDSFEEFVTSALHDKARCSTDGTPYGALMSEWLLLNGVPVIDLMLRMERLDDEFPILAARLGIENIPLGLHNVHEHPPYTDLYNARTVAIVSEAEAWTIKRFGYRYGEDMKCTIPAFNRG